MIADIGIRRFPILVPLLLAAVAAVAAVAAMLPGGTLGTCALLLFGLSLTLAFRREPGLQLVVIAAFVVRAGAALVHAYAVALPDSQLDARSFEMLAQDWAMGGWATVIKNFSIGAFTYPWLISVPYLVLGHSQLMAQSFNVLLGTLVVVNVYRLARHYYDHRTALRLCWIAALFPSLVLYSAITMREVFVTYPLTLGLVYFSRWITEHSPRLFIMGSLCFLIAGTFHYAILMCYVTFVSIFFVRNFAAAIRSRNALQVLLQAGVGLVVVPVMLYAALNYQTDFGRLADVVVDLPKTLQLIDRVMASRAEGRLAYLQTAEIKTFADFLTVAPLRLLYFLFSPFPWNLQAAADAFLALDGIFYALLVAGAILSLIRGHASVSTWPIFAAIVTMAIVFSFGTSNSGTAFRHRGKIAPLLIAVSAAFVRPSRGRTGTPPAPIPASPQVSSLH